MFFLHEDVEDYHPRLPMEALGNLSSPVADLTAGFKTVDETEFYKSTTVTLLPGSPWVLSSRLYPGDHFRSSQEFELRDGREKNPQTGKKKKTSAMDDFTELHIAFFKSGPENSL